MAYYSVPTVELPLNLAVQGI